MLQPTDRVLAKTVVKMYALLGQEFDTETFVNLSIGNIIEASNGNEAVAIGVTQLLQEVLEEHRAEKAGTAVSVDAPSASRHENWD